MISKYPTLYLCSICFELSSHGFGLQKCDCEIMTETYKVDCPNGIHLCYVCCKRVAGGTSRWSWEACQVCLSANNSLKSKGKAYLNLGRHSLMNGIVGKISGNSAELDSSIKLIMSFSQSMRLLHESALIRTEILYKSVKKWNHVKQIPIRAWERQFNPQDSNLEFERVQKRILNLVIETSEERI